MNTNFDDQPASCFQQFNVWKEQVVRYQHFSGQELPDFIKLSAVMNGLKGNVKSFMLLNLDIDNSFGDLDNLLARYSMHDQHESSFNSLHDIARRDMSAWYNPSKQQHRTAQTLEKRYQHHVYKIDQPAAYNSLASDNSLMSSLDHETQASSLEPQKQATTQSASTTPTYIIAQLDSLENASSTAETWDI